MKPGEHTWQARYRWTLEETVAVGDIRVPSGVLAIGDPWWSFEGLAIQLEIPPGAYQVRRVIARTTEAVEGSIREENAGIALVISRETAVANWEFVPASRFLGDHDGFWTEVGAVGYGEPACLKPGLVHEHDDAMPRLLNDGSLVLSGSDGDLACARVGPQHQECLTWKGVDEAANVSVVFTDLGMLDLDPAVTEPAWI